MDNPLLHMLALGLIIAIALFLLNTGRIQASSTTPQRKKFALAAALLFTCAALLLPWLMSILR